MAFTGLSLEVGEVDPDSGLIARTSGGNHVEIAILTSTDIFVSIRHH
jgi:hypothetical protein